MTPATSLYLLKDGQQTGPFPTDELRQRLGSGEVAAGDLVWGEGMAEWATLGSVLGLESSDTAGNEAAAGESPSWNRAAVGDVAAAFGEERGFGAMLLDALAYPFRGDGFIILALGTVLFTVLDFVGMFSWIISAAAWGYLLLMLQQVLHGTAMGEDRVPNWPDFDGFGQLLGKTFQWVGVLVACFGPGIFLAFNTPEDDTVRVLLSVGLLFAGLAIAPMALLSVGMHDTLNGLHPVFLMKSLGRAPGHYIGMLVVFAALAGVQVLAGKLSDMIPIAGVVIDKLDEIWTAVFIARVMGAFYFVNRRQLSWFGEG
ncbi:MAG: domain 2 [Verrucomicrobiota bacterium]